MSNSLSSDDMEKYPEKNVNVKSGIVDTVEEVSPETALNERFKSPFMKKLFSMGVEARGIERVPESERTPKGAFDSLTLWFSVNAVLTTVPIGVLAQQYFTLTLPHAISVIFCFAALGCSTVAFIATLGPKTGLRTMIITRYSGGHIGGFIFAFLNILTQIGFSTTAVILGGQTLASINNTLPLEVGIVIISLCTLIICFFGYNLLHTWERYAWIVTTIIFIMIYSLGGKAGYNISAQIDSEEVGKSLIGSVLSFGGIIFGSCSGWSPIVADLNVNLPENTSSTRIFILTFFGLFIPITFVEILGATLMTITQEDYINAFGDGNTGALLAQVLSPWGRFGQFILVLLSLSVISNNVPNTYSTALSIQALWKPLSKIPRFAWTIATAIIYMVAGIAGRQSFAIILSNLLSILSYWTAFFIVITAQEHFLFRRPNGPLGGYNLTEAGYTEASLLPPGFACVFAICCGITGAIVGMASTYWVGPIALLVTNPDSQFGGDLGFELSAAFSGIGYPIARYFEIKMFGR